MARSYRTIRLSSAPLTSEIRTAVFEEREHLVVSCVALVGNEVIWPSNAPGPEYVPADVIRRSTREWNGRPVVCDHPKDDGGIPVSANDPSTYERSCFGRIANPRYDNGRLVLEAWLDPQRADKVGSDATRVIKRAEARLPIEVSIGALVEVEVVEGFAPNGKPYSGVWLDIGSDHLAMLPEGTEGACSIAMGCGAPRVNRAQTKAAIQSKDSVLNLLNSNLSGRYAKVEMRAAEAAMSETTTKAKVPSTFSRFLSALGFRSAQDEDGVSDVDLRQSLWTKLRATEPAFGGIIEVYPDSSTVIYTTYPEDEVFWWKRTFTIGDDEEVALNDDAQQVEPTMKYEPVAAEGTSESAQTAQPTTAVAGCSCHSRTQTPTQEGQTPGNGPAAPSQTEGGAMETVKDVAGRLIANARSPYKEADRAVLESFGAARLLELEAAVPKEETQPPAPVSPPQTPAETPKKDGDGKAKDGSEEEEEPAGTVAIPAEELSTLRRLAARAEAADAARKSALISVLKGAQKVHSEAALKALSLDRLEEVAALVGVGTEAKQTPDYTGRAGVLSSDTDYPAPPEDPYNTAALQAAARSRAGRAPVSKEN